MGPGPIPKKGCESPVSMLQLKFFLTMVMDFTRELNCNVPFYTIHYYQGTKNSTRPLVITSEI